MKISTKNYFQVVDEIGLDKLPDVLRNVFELISGNTRQGEDWSLYENDPDFKRLADMNFSKLEEFSAKQELSGASEMSEPEDNLNTDGLNGAILTPRDVAKELIRGSLEKGDTIDFLKTGNEALQIDTPDTRARVAGESVVVTRIYGTEICEVFQINDLIRELSAEWQMPSKGIERVKRERRTFKHKQPEFRLIKGFLNWQRQLVTKKMVSSFLNDIVNCRWKGLLSETRVEDTIHLIYSFLGDLFQTMGETHRVEIPPHMIDQCKRSLSIVQDPAQKKSGHSSDNGNAEYQGEGLAAASDKSGEKAILWLAAQKFATRLIAHFREHGYSIKELRSAELEYEEERNQGRIEDEHVFVTKLANKPCTFTFEISEMWGKDDEEELLYSLSRNAAARIVAHFLKGGYSFDKLSESKLNYEDSESEAQIKHGSIYIYKAAGRISSHVFELAELKGSQNLKDWMSGKLQIQYSDHYRAEKKYISVFLNLEGKKKEKKEIDTFITDMQVAIEKRELSKESPFKNELNFIQEFLVRLYNTTKGNTLKVTLKTAERKRMQAALEKMKSLRPTKQKPDLPEKQRVVDFKGLNGVQQPESALTNPSQIISSSELLNTHFPTIGFKGKWKDFIGDPAPGFKAAVSGLPKMGKTYWCIDFADYLSQNHGRVLYVSKEEFSSPTLNFKLKQKNIGNPNLDFTGTIPADLTAYAYIFLDSVSSLKLSAEDLKKLEANNPGKSFIYVFQVTKTGKARGTNEFMHNVDIIIEVPEKGKAVQFGRYNQGGEMDIFTGPEPSLEQKTEMPSLAGVAENESSLQGTLKPKPLPSLYKGFSISSAAHDPQTLVKRMVAFAEKVKGQTGIIRQLARIKDELDEKPSDDTLQFLIDDELIPMLDSIAPKGTRFGAHPGDSADYGFWSEDESLEGSKPPANKETEKLLQELQHQIRLVEQINLSIYKTRSPNWGNVASLARIHAHIGERLHDGYSEHHGYSESIKAGMDRHYKANKKLLKELGWKVKHYADHAHIAEMMDWLDWIKIITEETFHNQLHSGQTTPVKPKKRKAIQQAPQKHKENDIDYADEYLALKIIFEDNQGIKLSDEDFNSLCDFASRTEKDFDKKIESTWYDLTGFLRCMDNAYSEWSDMKGSGGNMDGVPKNKKPGFKFFRRSKRN